MLTGKDMATISHHASQLADMTNINWHEDYLEKLADLVNAHFTHTAAVNVAQEPLACDVFEQLSNMPEEKQALVYQFLYRIGHRIY